MHLGPGEEHHERQNFLNQRFVMTAQIPENLMIDGQRHTMLDEPLWQYFKLGGTKPKFTSPHTACWRGYVGSWELVDSRLYLVDLEGWLEGGGKVTLAHLFPHYPHRVFAHWFSDKVRIPEGKMIKYVHMGYASKFERDQFLYFEKGVHVRTEVCENGIAPEGASSGYGVGALTVLR